MGRISLCVLVFMSVVAVVLSDTAAAPAAAPAAAAAAPAAPAAAGAPAAPAAAVPAQAQNNIMTGAMKLVTSVPKGVITMCKDVTDAFLEMLSFGK